MDFAVRLQVLRDAGCLSEKNGRLIEDIIAMLGDKWQLKLTEDNGAAFVTHMATALERMDRGEVVNSVDACVLAELQSQPCFSRCREMIGDIAGLCGTPLPETEEGYFLIHLCTILAREE